MPRFSPLTADDPRTVAGYPLRARLGAGGMGRVYLSFTPGGRAIAIKVVRPEFADDEEFRRRFRQEVAAAQRVQGLYTAPVVDSGADAELPWLATAYVPGPSLQEAVSEHGPLPLPTVYRLLAGVAEALGTIHAAGLIHRDLKPANVLLADDGPRVIDFGIARAAEATTATRTGVRVGTPGYMAPEQVRGQNASAATDVFALAQLTTFAATGNTAFGDGNTDALFYRIVHEAPNLEGCPEPLTGILERCLAKDPAERPGVNELIDFARAQTAGETLNLASSWLPSKIATQLAAYETSAVAAPPTAPMGQPQQGTLPVPPPGAVAPPPVGPPPANVGPAAANMASPHQGVPSPQGASTPPPNGPSTPAPNGPSTQPPGTPTAPPNSGPTTPPPGGPGWQPVNLPPPFAARPPASGRKAPVPLIVLGVAAGVVVIALIVALASLTSSSGGSSGGSNNAAAQPPVQVPTDGSTDNGDGSPSSSATPTSLGTAQEYSGTQFTFPGGDCTSGSFSNGVNFTAQGPKVDVESYSDDFVYGCDNGSPVMTAHGVQIAVVDSSQDEPGCYNAVNLHPLDGTVPYANMTKGMKLCMVNTTTKQVVYLELQDKSSSSAITWAATGWTLPASQQQN